MQDHGYEPDDSWQDAPEVILLQQKARVTRKPHPCIRCKKQFPAGSKMEYVVLIEDGTFVHFYECLNCAHGWEMEQEEPQACQTGV